MQTYPNNGFVSYWKYLGKTSSFDKKTQASRSLRTLQTAIRLTGLILKNAGIELLFLLVFWAIMTKMSQGRDLVVSFFEPGGIYKEGRAIFTLLSVVSFSVSMWIIPAFLFQIRDKKNIGKSHYRSVFRQHLFFAHRVLPLIPFWLLAYVLFNGELVSSVFISLSLLELTLLFIFNSYVKNTVHRRIYFAVLLLLFCAAFVLFSFAYHNTYLSAKIAFAFVLYLLSFIMYFVYHKVDQEILAENERIDIDTANSLRKYTINSSFYLLAFIIHLVIVSIIFAAPRFTTTLKIAPESMLLYIFSVNIFMIDLVVYFINVTPRRKFIATIAFFLIAAVYATPLLNLNLSHYTVDENPAPSVLKNKERLSFEDRYAMLKDSIKSYKGVAPYPVILVSGDGGGSRAGMWFSQNLINFDYQTNGQFRNYIFSMSTVSGSSVGVGTLFSYWNETQADTSLAKWRNLPSSVYATNFVGSSIRGLLLTDFWKTLIPGSWTSDRNSVLQYEEAYYTQQACDKINGIHKQVGSSPDTSVLDNDFMNFFYDTTGNYLHLKGGVPLVLINTCRSNDGRRGIFSPVKLTDDVFNDAIDINGYLYDDSVCSYNGKKDCSSRKKNISLEQACNTSELFPIFSTPAYIDSLGSFVDGGYHENSGLKTTLDVYDKLSSMLRNENSLKGKYKIYILYIKNGSGDKNLYQPYPSKAPLTLPLQALTSQPFEGSQSYFEERAKFVGSRDDQAEYIEIKLDNHYITDTTQLLTHGDSTVQRQILADLRKSKKDSTLNIPLARWLSKSVISRMEVNARDQLRNVPALKLLIKDINDVKK